MENNSFFKKNDKKYNDKEVVLKIMVVQNLTKINPNNPKIPKLKKEIFSMLKNLVNKNINNYLKYSRNSPIKEDAATFLELENQSFLIFEQCLANFNFKYNFYFYFNKSISVNFYRSFNKEVRDKKKASDFASHKIYTSKNDISSPNLTVEFFNVKLTDVEKLVMNSKLEYEKKEDFLLKNPQLNSTQYSRALKRIKELLIKMKEDGDL